MQARRNEEVASARRRAAGEDRRLDLYELIPVHEVANDLVDATSELEHAGHPRATQVEVPVFQSRLLVRLPEIFDWKRSSLRCVDALEVRAGHLHLARRHTRVLRTRRSAADDSLDPDHVFGPKACRGRVR